MKLKGIISMILCAAMVSAVIPAAAISGSSYVLGPFLTADMSVDQGSGTSANPGSVQNVSFGAAQNIDEISALFGINENGKGLSFDMVNCIDNLGAASVWTGSVSKKILLEADSELDFYILGYTNQPMRIFGIYEGGNELALAEKVNADFYYSSANYLSVYHAHAALGRGEHTIKITAPSEQSAPCFGGLVILSDSPISDGDALDKAQYIEPVADTSVHSWRAQKLFNNGAADKLKLRYAPAQTDNSFFHDPTVQNATDSTDIKMAYIKFDPKKFTDLSHGIKYASLRLASEADISAFSMDIYSASGDWIEGTGSDTTEAADGSNGMTWYSRPELGRLLATAQGKETGIYTDIDVTDYVIEAGSSPVTFAVLSNQSNTSENELTIGSRESGLSPKLAILPYSDAEIEAASRELKEEIDFTALNIPLGYYNISVGGSVSLPTQGIYSGSEIIWRSSKEGILDSDGIVGVDFDGFAQVTLTAELCGREKEFTVMLNAGEYHDYEVNVSAEKGADIDSSMFGLFFEDINYAADGGIMAEMLENRSFEFFNSASAYDYGWSTVGTGVSFTVNDNYPLNDNNIHCLAITAEDVSGGVKNKAYDGIYMEKDQQYNVSLYLNRAGSYDGDISVSVEKDGATYGDVILAESSDSVPDCVADGWVKYSGVITPTHDIDGGDFVLRLTQPGTVLIDMVSCASSDAVRGLFRRDIFETLSEMNPGFVRFPGGCAVEGGSTLATAYRWKETVGPVEQRKLNKSRWQSGNSRYYCQSFNLGFYEYFIMCEELGAKPLPVVNAGLACMVNSNPEAVPVYKDSSKTWSTASENDLSDEFMAYVNDIIDLIDFANGTDFDNEWAALRRSMGHEKPFNLEMIGVGNEQWERGGNQWHDRYYWIEHFVHKKDPDIKLISSAAWYHTGNPIHTAEYAFLRERLAENPGFTFAADEHYYETPNWFYGNMDYYDKYPRDVNVFLGEVSARWDKIPGDYTICTLENALAEAAYFTMLERNSDIVKMVSAAPLLCRVGGTKYSQWSPNLVWFGGKGVFQTPSFYVQSMYGQNTGDFSYKSTLLCHADEETAVFENVSYDAESGDLIIKLVNSSAEEKNVSFNIDESIPLTSDRAKVITLSSDSNLDYNSLDEPEKVSPAVTYEGGFGHEFSYDAPANSFTIIRIGRSGEPEINTPETSRYLMVHFVEGAPDGSRLDEEQIYFSVSDDGNSWKMLNNMEPVLRSSLGSGGLRDPHIIRSYDGTKFYLVATDLSIIRQPSWADAQQRGSRSIMVWESDDLINWSEQRMCEIALPTAGCAWAPESVYDEERAQYMLFWSSLTSDNGYDYHRVYRCFTKDFKSFTAPELYIDNGYSTIDVTIKKIGSRYYRLSKNEDTKSVYFEVSQSTDETRYPLDGKWSRIEGDTINQITSAGSDPRWEGALLYKVNGENGSWRVMVDHYGGWTEDFPASTKGLTQFETSDIASADFYSINGALSLPQYSDRNGSVNGSGKVVYKHGAVLPITDKEYKALVDRYGISKKPAPSENSVTYSFPADAVKSDGFANNGDCYEWVINSAPQYFSFGEIDFDNVKSISIKSGYKSGSAVTAVYACGGELTAERLKSFAADKAPLGEPVGTVADSKTSQWGYRTAVISADGVYKTDGAAYNISSDSQSLKIPEGTGVKSIVVGIEGDLGGTGYFAELTVEYKNGEKDSLVFTELLTSGENITYSIETSLGNAHVFCAAYSADGKLLYLGGEEGSFPADESISKIEAFAWEENTMKPLCEKIKRTISAGEPGAY